MKKIFSAQKLVINRICNTISYKTRRTTRFIPPLTSSKNSLITESVKLIIGEALENEKRYFNTRSRKKKRYKKDFDDR